MPTTRADSSTSPKPSDERAITSVTTFLWFDTEAERAANYYTSLLGTDRNITDAHNYGTAGPRPE